MFTFRSKFLLSFLACMCIPIAIAIVGRDFYETRAELAVNTQLVEQTHQELLLLYQNDANALNQEQINPVFFEFGTTRLIQTHSNNIERIQQDLARLQASFADDKQATRYLEDISARVKLYQQMFQILLERVRQRGFQDFGQIGEMRTKAHHIEQQVESTPELLVHALMLRRHEKDYIIRNQPSYIDLLVDRANRFVLAVEKTSSLNETEKRNLTQLIDEYVAQFLIVVNTDYEIGLKGHTGTYQEIQTLRSQIQQQYGLLTEHISSRSDNLNHALNRQLLTSVIALTIFAVLLSIYLSKTLTTPLLQLAKRIRAFTDDNFRQRVDLNDLLSINDEVGNLARNFATLQDHTLDSIQKLEAQRTTAQQANKAKSLFLANMSHELRTPLNGIIGMSQLLNTTPLNDEQKNFSETIQHASNGLLAIVSDILDFSKIEAGKIELEPTDFDLIEAFNMVVKPFQAEAKAKQLDFHINLENADVRWLHGDVSRWSQILRNLVSNAIKFTHTGSISIQLESRLHEGNVTVILTVEDTGIGIAPEALKHIFEAFRQADNTTTRRFGGTGLGLSICSELAKEMSGVLSVKSTPGQGSIFDAVVNMPPGQSPVRQLPEDNRPLDLYVLVAEDNPLNQKIIERMLMNLGAQSEVVENGEEALDRLSQQSFDLVLMDIQMPIMDGLTAVSKLREREQGTHQLVYALTANATQDDRTSALDAGMDGFLTKPISIQALRKTLEKITPGSGRSPTGNLAG